MNEKDKLKDELKRMLVLLSNVTNTKNKEDIENLWKSFLEALGLKVDAVNLEVDERLDWLAVIDTLSRIVTGDGLFALVERIKTIELSSDDLGDFDGTLSPLAV